MPTALRLLLAIASLALASCGRMEQSARARPGDGAVIFQSTILTMDARRPGAEALIVKDGVIVDVGAIDDLVQAYPGAKFDEKYLRKVLTPSFVDARLPANALGVIEIPCNGDLLADDVASAGRGGAPVRVIASGPVALNAALEAVRRIPDKGAIGRISIEARGAIAADAAREIAASGAVLILSAEPSAADCAGAPEDAVGTGAGAPTLISGGIAVSPRSGDQDFLGAAARFMNDIAPVRLSPVEAFEAITIDAASAIGLENDRGSIAPGKRASFAVLDRNPMATPAEAWSAIKVSAVDLAPAP